MGRLLTLLRAAGPPARVAAANNCNLPTNYNTMTAWVHNAWTTHLSGPAGYTAVDLLFVNGLIGTNSEQNAFYDFLLNAGVYLNGAFYPADFGAGPGQPVTVSRNWGVARGRVTVPVPPNTAFVVTNRRVAADAGAAGSYNVLTNTSGTLARQDGVLGGTDPSKDYTLGVGVPYGAKAGAVAVNGSGTVTSIPVAQAKAAASPAYPNGGITLGFWFGPAGAGQPGATIPGSPPTGGYGTLSGGGLSGIYPGSGGSGMLTANPPLAFVGGGGGFGGGTTASYGPSLITGVPAGRTPSVLLHGDSITAGYGSVDGLGDLGGSYGWYEQLLAGRYGVHKLAVSGESAAGWVGNNAQQLAFIDAAIRQGLKPTHVVLALGVNDFLTNTNSDVLSFTQGKVAQIAAAWRSRGAKVLMTTIPPNCTTTATSNKYTTLAEQTPANANYAAGGAVDQYNAALLAATGPANDGVLDGGSLMRDATDHTKWRVDCYGGGTAFCAPDGTHPSVGVGIPYLRANVPVPALA